MTTIAQDKTVCRCLNVAESTIQDAASFGGCESLCDVKQSTGAGTGCMSCHARIKTMLREYAEKRALERADTV
ncbi:MAG: (2Fe-2S)-binding protein [Planctomycetaceae bacterium]|nr:(2Fe-2S)-binding protein [Planctomycetaceae bacterium]